MEGDETAAGFDVVAIGIEVGANLQIVDPELLLVHIAVGVLVLGSSETTHLAADFELAFIIQVNFF